jgi:hypothetical protein
MYLGDVVVCIQSKIRITQNIPGIPHQLLSRDNTCPPHKVKLSQSSEHPDPHGMDIKNPILRHGTGTFLNIDKQNQCIMLWYFF